MKTALVDSDIVAYRAAVLTENDSVEAGIELSERIHESWLDASRCDMLVPCLTVGRNFRAEAWPAYKANRADKPKPRHLNDIRKHILSKDTVMIHNGWEADDIIGFLHTTGNDLDTVVVTVDKDMDQLPGWHCNPDKETIYEVSVEDAAMYRWMQVLSGDPTDNYPGIPKIGEKKALKFLEDVSVADYETTVAAIYADKGLDADYLRAMTVCATIKQYTKELVCELLSPDSNVESTLVPFLRSRWPVPPSPGPAGTSSIP